MSREGLIAIRPNPARNKQFADPQLFLACAADSLNTNVLLITQDSKLRSDVEAINNQESVERDYLVEVQKLYPNGMLEPFYSEEREQSEGEGCAQVIGLGIFFLFILVLFLGS